MKNLIKGILVFILITSCSSSDDPIDADASDFKRYLVKSGQVDYEITISGSVLNSTFKGNGTAVVYFKNWGNLELNEEKRTTTTTTVLMTGQTIVDTDVHHEINKLENLFSYVVDIKNKKIYKSEDSLLALVKSLPDYDPKKVAEQIMIQNGGKKLGNENYMNYDCEVWQFLGSKTWVYKGVTLKIITDLAGMHIEKKATKVVFDVVIDESKFNLPNYKIIEM